MTSNKPPAGMRDFLPETLANRQHVLDIIRRTYQSHHFQPIETPALERIEVLTGKYGQEGDQLLFRVLKRGEKLKSAESLESADLCDLGLRYDLTVPLSRFVAQYQNELPRIFKCFQMRPVWRADRPAKGRFREFYQCDLDIVGCDSVLVEVDVLSAAMEALVALAFEDFSVRINHRDLLFALTREAGIHDTQAEPALVSLDKLDKIGWPGVRAELLGQKLEETVVKRLESIMNACCQAGQEPSERLRALAEALGEQPASALERLDQLFALLKAAAPEVGTIIYDPSLVRGMSYYTGPIFEIELPGFSGSVGGGGRYDNLIGMFLGRSIPACGVSLGVERIILIMEERAMFAGLSNQPDVFVTCFPEVSPASGLKLASLLRERGLVVSQASEPARLKKQLALAAKEGAKVVVIIGESEEQAEQVTLKDMQRKEQRTVKREEAVAEILSMV